MGWSNIKKAFSDFDPFSGISQNIETEHETWLEKTERESKENKKRLEKEKELFLKDNPQPKNDWCGAEYEFYQYALHETTTIGWGLGYHEKKHTTKIENGIEIEYCTANKKFKKIKYKEVK